jgi:hypothetical protein
MKRIFTLFAIALCSVSLIQAQVVLTYATHGFTTGLNHECNSVEYQAPGEAGTDLVWDFSQVSLTQEAPLSKSIVGKNLTKSTHESNIVVDRNDQVSFMFNNTESKNEYVGYQTGEISVVLTEPIVKTKYPQSFGTYFEGNYSGTFSCSCATSGQTTNLHGFYSTHADATGVILLPNNIQLQALRVHTVETMEYGNSETYSEHVKYLWYAQSERFPVFVSLESYSVNKTSGERRMVGQTSFLNSNVSPVAPTGIAPIDANSEIAYKVFPNPVKNSIEVNYSLPEELPVSIDLYNSKGIKLATLLNHQLQQGNNSFKKDVSKYIQTQDVYFLRLSFGNKVFTEKLIKERK